MAKKIKEYSFRELENNYIFINNEPLAKAMSQFFEADDTANGVVVYGYNNHVAGLGFEVLTTASLDNGRLKLGKGNEAASLQLKFSDIAEEEVLLLPMVLPVWEQFAEKVRLVNTANEVDEEVSATRRVLNLDSCRSLEIPDQVTVHLVKGELIEACQVRLEGMQKMFLLGTLLEEPGHDFGVHEGSTLSFYNVKNEQGIMCLAIFQ